jgi:hypothetical protein
VLSAAFIAAAFVGLARYEFHPLPNRVVAIETDEQLTLGTLTTEGEFKVKSRFDFQKTEGGLTSLLYSGPPYTALNSTAVASENTVYELRKKTLVPGRLSWTGVFTADPKKESIPFEQYQFTPSAPPIWNLPGVFLPAGSKIPSVLDSTGLPSTPKPPKRQTDKR